MNTESAPVEASPVPGSAASPSQSAPIGDAIGGAGGVPGAQPISRALTRRRVKVNMWISAISALGFVCFWVCQNDFFEGHVMEHVILKAKEEYATKLQRSEELRRVRKGNAWRAVESLSAMVAPRGMTNEADSLSTWLDSLQKGTGAGFSRSDTLQLRGITNRLLGLLRAQARRNSSLGQKLSKTRSEGFCPADWLASVASGLGLSLVLGAVVFVLLSVFQRSRTENGNYYAGAMLLCIILPMVAAYLVLFWWLWKRDFGDVYWVWALPYSVVITAVANAWQEPVFKNDRDKVLSNLSRRDDVASSRALAWLTSRIDQDKTMQGWVLIVAFALGFTLLFGALQSQGEGMTRDGMARYAFEFAILSVYIWLVGIIGVFMRYGIRVKKMQRLLSGWGTDGFPGTR